MNERNWVLKKVNFKLKLGMFKVFLLEFIESIPKLCNQSTRIWQCFEILNIMKYELMLDICRLYLLIQTYFKLQFSTVLNWK